MKTLPHKTIDNPNAVEEFFCKEFDKAPKSPMDKEDLELFMQLYLSKTIPLADVAKKDKFFLYELIEKRVAGCFGYKITDARVIVILSTMAKTAGSAVMYLTYLQYKCKKDNIKEVTFDYICKLFPDGFIPDHELHKVWLMQKVEKGKNGSMSSDNLLDYQSAMKSIQF